MPFIPDENTFGPISIDPKMNLTPKPEGQKTGAGAVIGAAFRTENPIVSALTSFDYDPLKPFDPEYRPWDEVQGTEYEAYGDRFTGARDATDVAAMKAQINQELEDRRTLDAAGASGMMAQMGAAILSPTTLLPGGALVKGAQGVKIGLTGLSVAGWTGLAAGIDEVMLHATQQTRTAEESAFAIGGSVILGGILGAGIGSLGKQEFKVAAQRAEQAVTMHNDFADGLRSIGAAENPQDFTIRREGFFAAVRKVPVLRAIVRSDPVIRPMLSELSSSRRALSDLVETPLQYKVNEEGQTVLNGEASVEALIKDRTHGSMVKSLSGLNKFYGEYWKDGPVGTLGTMVAPLQRWTQNLAGKTEKLSSRDFMEEVGKAMRRDDKHPIPQVQAAADMLRKEIFDPIKEEAIDFGIFDETLTELKHGNSYFSRVYQQEKIIAHRGDGSENDIMPTLRREFEKRRDIAQQNMAFDRRVADLEADQFKLKENIRGTQRALDTARSKAVAKRERAKGADGRSKAVGRATGALRRVFEKRSDDLKALTFTDAETDALKYALSDARGVKRLRPTDLLEAIRGYGGIKDPKIGTRWNGKGWSGGSATEIEMSLDTRARSIRRKDGRDIDTVREAMIDAGYLEDGATVNDLLDAIDRAARGDDIFSRYDMGEEFARYEAALAFADEMDRLGVDISKPIDKIIADLPNTARNPKTAKVKAGEAERSGNVAGKAEDGAEAGVLKALDRLEEAQARIRELDEEIAPKVRDEIKAARAELQKVIPELKKAKKAQDVEDFYANATDADIAAAVSDTVNALTGMKPGEAHYKAAMSNPTRARVLDVPDEVIEPWLQSNAQDVMAQYFRSMVPDLEIIKKFGDLEMTKVQERINAEAARLMEQADGPKARNRIKKERDENLRDLLAMRDRMRGVYGVPADPRSGWIQGARTVRTLSYMGFLGGMTISAIPDVANVVGRAGIQAAFGGSFTAITDPRRLKLAAMDMAELNSAADWHLNSRSIALGDMFDPYGGGTRLEKGLAKGAAVFSQATGMVAWNVFWKSVGGAMVASKMSKAAERMAAGKASTKDMAALASNGIDRLWAQRISAQIAKHGDTNGTLWLPRGQNWDDREAFDVFRQAMNREFDIMIVTPGQDLPLSFSSETGKFFLQFKSFAFSAHHRILLAGIQRADADVLAQVVGAMALGALVSNIKAMQAGNEPKEGAALWEDALDRSGLGGWLMEPYALAGALTNGATSISGEEVSRYKSRSEAQGLLGPGVDMAVGMFEGAAAYGAGDASYRDVRKIMRPIPGNNLVWLTGVTRQIEDAVVEATGAKPRE
jgi:hypothetical protein